MATTRGAHPGPAGSKASKQRPKGKPVATVKFGSASVPVYRCQSGKRVRFVISHYRDGRRLRRFFGTLDAARNEARLVAQRIQSGMQHVTDMAPHDRDAYLTAGKLLADLGMPLVAAVEEYVRARKLLDGLGTPLVATVEDYVRARQLAGNESLAAMAAEYSKHFAKVVRRATVPEVVEQLIASKAQDGVSRRHLGQLRSILIRFAAAHDGPILDITSADVDAWLRSLNVAPSTRNSIQLYLNLLFSFALEQNYLPEGKPTATNQLRKLRVTKGTDVEIHTPDQFRTIIHAAPPHLVPLLAIGAFAGIRMAELARLDWKAVDLDRRFIEVRAGQAKTASRRLVPISDNLAAWLRPLDRTGKVVRSTELVNQATALAAALGVEWPRNVLRHSFISYRIAVVKSADQVALEAGNSPAIIFKHYRELTTEDQAAAWFSILPKRGQWKNTFTFDWRNRTVTLPDRSKD